MIMTDEQLAVYQTQGFVVLNHVFTAAEMSGLAILIEAHHQAHEQRLQSEGIRKAYVIQYSVAGLRDAATGKVLPDKQPVTRRGLPATGN
jgi:hypothetical protein